MSQPTAEIVFLPVQERAGDPVREAVWNLDCRQLLAAAGTLIRMADDAAGREDDEDFYNRVSAAYLCLERVLVEQAAN